MKTVLRKTVLRKALSVLLALCLCTALMPFSVLGEGGGVCEIVGGDTFTTLGEALDVVPDGGTILLLDNINYSSGIVIKDKSITFNLNGFNLNVDNPLTEGSDKERTGLYMEGNAAVGLEGGGEFNVKGNKYGVFVYVEGGAAAAATVTNAAATGNDDCAAYAYGKNAIIIVQGNATATGVGGIGAMAESLGLITVKGNVIATADHLSGENDCAAVTAWDDGEVIVEGNVTATGTKSIGVLAAGSSVTVGGDVSGVLGGAYATASASIEITGNVCSTDASGFGVQAIDNCSIDVGGNVQSVGTGAVLTGVPELDSPSEITIDGVITAPDYIQIGESILGVDDYVLDSDLIPGYRIYTIDSNFGSVLVAEFDGGDGSEGTPYLIATPEHLNNVRHYLGTGHADKHFQLTVDLDLNVAPHNTGKGWEPIGMSDDFTGSFDGGGHTISGLVINRPDQDDIGLFGYAETTAKIRNLGLVGVNVTGCNYVGGLVGGNRGLVTNSYVTGDVKGERRVGGLVGINYGSIAYSYATCTVRGTETDIYYTYVGGLVGSNIGSISESYARGAVFGQENIGGLVGYNSSFITNSYATGAVTGDSYIGGLVGFNNSAENVTNSFWDKETSQQKTSDGGTGKSTVEMKQQGTYSSWDFDNIWVLDPTNNEGYPSLRWSAAVLQAEIPTANPGTGTYVNTQSVQLSTATAGATIYYTTDGSVPTAESVPYTGAITVAADMTIKAIAVKAGLTNSPIATFSYVIQSEFAGGDGSIESPYLIATADQLNKVRNYLDKHFELIANISLDSYKAGAGWIPIGSNDTNQAFAGSFDGDGHTISNLVINSTVASGLFGYVKAGAEIRNLKLENIDLTSSDEVGGLAGDNRGIIISCSAKGTVRGTWSSCVGGLVGDNEGSITSCYFDGTVTSTDDYVGGLVGRSIGSITNSYASGSVTGEDDVGGLVGYNHIYNGSKGEIIGCYATCTVVGTWNSIGGLVGDNAGPISNCYANGTTTGNNPRCEFIGGLVGLNYSPISNSYAIGAVSGPAEVGGLVGDNNSAAITNCYWGIKETGLALSDGGTGKSTLELKQQTTYADWNFTTIWNIKDSVNNGYPYLRWQDVQDNPPQTYLLTITAGTGGSITIGINGNYAAGTVINIAATPSSGYSFNKWSSVGGGTFGSSASASTTFTMPANAVTITAGFKYNGSGGGGGGSSTPPTPSYKADVRTENGTETTLPVTVDEDAGNVSINVDSQNFAPGGTVITIPSVPGVGTYSAGIPVPNLSTIDVQSTLALNTNLGSITVPSNMLTGVAGADGNKAQITIGQGDKSTLPGDVKTAIGDRPLLRLTMSIDGKQTDWSNPKAPVTVAIPYTPTPEELARPEHITVWYIDGSGRANSMNGQYDPLSGTVIFTTTHFSYYAVVYDPVARLAGTDRVETGLRIARAAYPDKVSHAVLATANSYPDALAGSVLASYLNAPILLVGSSEGDQGKVISYLSANLKPEGKVYILGGTGVISQSFADKLRTAAIMNSRIAGKDRYDTSGNISEQLNVKTGTPVVLVSGENYPDALAVSSAAAQNQFPIFLVQKDSISKAVSQELADIKPSKIYLVGLEGAISPAVASQAAKNAGLAAEDIVRIGGVDRYATSLAVAEYFNLGSQTLCIATGKNYPDALAGSVYAAKYKAPIILIDSTLPTQTADYVKSGKPNETVIFGGEAVVGRTIEQQIRQLLNRERGVIECGNI